MAEWDNIHATGVVLGDRGLVILGRSGSGKTGLAIALIDHARRCGLFACLVGDDQLFVLCRASRLILRAPHTIMGLAEVRGLGPAAMTFEPEAVADIAARLVDPSGAPRMPEAGWETIHGVRLPCLTLSAGDRQAALFAVAAQIGMPPFSPLTGRAPTRS